MGTNRRHISGLGRAKSFPLAKTVGRGQSSDTEAVRGSKGRLRRVPSSSFAKTPRRTSRSRLPCAARGSRARVASSRSRAPAVSRSLRRRRPRRDPRPGVTATRSCSPRGGRGHTLRHDATSSVRVPRTRPLSDPPRARPSGGHDEIGPAQTHKNSSQRPDSSYLHVKEILSGMV